MDHVSFVDDFMSATPVLPSQLSCWSIYQTRIDVFIIRQSIGGCSMCILVFPIALISNVFCANFFFCLFVLVFQIFFALSFNLIYFFLFTAGTITDKQIFTGQPQN